MESTDYLYSSVHVVIICQFAFYAADKAKQLYTVQPRTNKPDSVYSIVHRILLHTFFTLLFAKAVQR